MLINRLKGLNQTGDTIVEVLVVLAVLSFAMAVSMSTANKGLNQSRNAQEHSQALGIVNSQVELLRSAARNEVDIYSKSQPFCMKDNTEITLVDSATQANINNLESYPNSCTQGFYRSSIVYHSSPPPPTEPYFEFRVLWDGIGGLGRQQETLVYRIRHLTNPPSPGLVLGTPAVPSPPPAPSPPPVPSVNATILMKTYLYGSCSNIDDYRGPYTDSVTAVIKSPGGTTESKGFRHAGVFQVSMPEGVSNTYEINLTPASGYRVCNNNVEVNLTDGGLASVDFQIERNLSSEGGD